MGHRQYPDIPTAFLEIWLCIWAIDVVEHNNIIVLMAQCSLIKKIRSFLFILSVKADQKVQTSPQCFVMQSCNIARIYAKKYLESSTLPINYVFHILHHGSIVSCVVIDNLSLSSIFVFAHLRNVQLICRNMTKYFSVDLNYIVELCTCKDAPA